MAAAERRSPPQPVVVADMADRRLGVSTWGNVARGIRNTTSPFSLPNASAYGSRLIDITFQVHDDTAGGTDQIVQTSLSGRNTEYGYDTGVCTPVPAP